MDNELKQLLHIQIRILDQIRKNTEVLSKSLGNKLIKPKLDPQVESLINGLPTRRIINGEINEQEIS